VVDTLLPFILYCLAGGSSLLKEITIQLTEHCNLRCPYCFAPKNGSNEISDNDFERFKRFCLENKVDCIHITGGEPALHSKFSKIVNELSFISTLVIYSNLTLPNCIDDIRENSDIFFLVNLNDKDFYSSQQWEVLNSNIVKIKQKSLRVGVGHTFFKMPIIQDFNYCIDFILSNAISHFRMSQAVMCQDTGVGLNKKEIEELYDYVAENIVAWEKKGIKAYFDCPIPPCFINLKVFDFLRKHRAVSIVCSPKVFVTWDYKLTHCYSTMGLFMPPFEKFKNINDASNYVKNIIAGISVNRDISLCNECKYEGIGLCGCPFYSISNKECAYENK